MENSKKVVMDVHSIDGGSTEKLFDMEKKDVHFDKVMAVEDDISDSTQMFSKLVDNEEEDVDCVILDGNPDKPVSIVNDGGDDSDDLCVVAENGQVACRDYPHPRHLCVKFPFNSTPHESYCDKCHCYVCDSVAPCVHWGNGVSIIDHCHASEKDSFWKTQRRLAKANDEALDFVSNVELTPTNQVLSLSSANPLMHNEEPPANKLCFISGTGTPDRVQERGCHPSNNFSPYLVQYQLQNQTVGRIGKQVVSEGGLTPANQVLWFPNNNPLMHNEEPPADNLCSATNLGAPYDPQVSGCDPSNNIQPQWFFYQLQQQSVGQAGTQFVPEGGLTPIGGAISLLNNKPLMHNEETPANELYSATSTGFPYGAHISGFHPGNNSHPNLVHYISQRQSVDHAGIQLVPEGDSTPTNLQLWPSNNPLMHNVEPSASQFGFVPGTGTSFDAQESGCHPGNNIGYELQRKKIGRADTQLIPQHVSSFKRPRTSGGTLSNTGYLSSSSRNNYGYQFSANPMLSTNSEHVAPNSVPNSSTWLGTEMGNYASLQAQVDAHVPRGSINANPVAPRLRTGSIFSSLAMTAPGVAIQPRPEGPFMNPVRWEPQAIFPPSVFEAVLPSILEQEQNQKLP